MKLPRLVAFLLALTTAGCATLPRALGAPYLHSSPPHADTPEPGPKTESPYVPKPLITGGIVVPLFSPDSAYLNPARVHESEKYGSYSPPHLGYIVNIHNPSIEFHPANAEKNTGSAIILAAGGGHNKLNVAGEGMDVVPFLTKNGINAVILRNRLRSDGYEPQTDGVYDAQQAVKLVRSKAQLWHLDPKRIGILGFSAGAELAAAAALYYETFDAQNDTPEIPLAKTSSRPDFIGLVYPGPSPFAFGGSATIPRDAPPAFFASPGWGDWIRAQWAIEYFAALHQDGVPNAELHLYARGVHPGDRSQPTQAPASAGISDRAGVAFGKWHESYLLWMSDLGFLQKSGLETLAARDVAQNRDRPERYRKYQDSFPARQIPSAKPTN